MIKILAARFSEEDIPEILENVLNTWTGGNAYADASKIGSVIEKLTKYLPFYVKKSPTSTLYRFVSISTRLLKKVQKGEKEAILRNRRYSSWTYNLDAAKDLAEANILDIINEGYTPIILRRTFSSDQILLNINEAYEFLGRQDPHEDENEIIVKNANKDYKFTSKDIYLYWYKGLWKIFR